ncbi:MAG: hypothetical protein RL042_2281, partial [Nitrospirota bacterium]
EMRVFSRLTRLWGWTVQARPPVRCLKALRRVWDGESDHRLPPLSINPSEGFLDVQDGIMGGESVMVLLRGGPPFDFSTPGFTPGSLPVYSRFQVQLNLTQSQCWEQKALVRQGDSSLCHTLSSSSALSLGGSSKLRVVGSIPTGRTIELYRLLSWFLPRVPGSCQSLSSSSSIMSAQVVIGGRVATGTPRFFATSSSRC